MRDRVQVFGEDALLNISVEREASGALFSQFLCFMTIRWFLCARLDFLQAMQRVTHVPQVPSQAPFVSARKHRALHCLWATA